MIEQLYLLFFYPAPYLVIIGEINYNKMIEKGMGFKVSLQAAERRSWIES